MKDIFANIFEFGGSFRGDYANELYDFVYVPIGFGLIFLVLLSSIVYYKIFDRPRFHRWWHWLSVLVLTSLVMLVVALLYTNGIFEKEGLDIGVGDYADFLIAVFINTAVLFFIFSILLKSFSINRSRTPF
jgi:hypothetical protein